MRNNTRHAWIVLLSLFALGGCLPEMGGCLWTETSAVELTPEVPCLTLALADASGQGDSTGCVDPVLVGENHCSRELALPASASAVDLALAVEPGGSFTFEVALHTAAEEPHDRYQFAVAAQLGDEPLTIRFQTWRD